MKNTKHPIHIRRESGSHESENLINSLVYLENEYYFSSHLFRIRQTKGMRIGALTLLARLISISLIPIAMLESLLKLFQICLARNWKLELVRLSSGPIYFGDSLSAEYLRRTESDGCLRPSILLLILVIRYTISIYCARIHAWVLGLFYDLDNSVSSITEKSYEAHVLRRILFNMGVHLETVWSPFHGKYIVYKMTSPEDVKKIAFSSFPTNQIDNRLIMSAEKTLLRRLYHGEVGHTANVGDVNCDLALNLEDFELNVNKPICIIFMHQTADMQFFFGVDRFLDIDTFHDIAIQIMISTGYQVWLKPHPNSNNPKQPEKSIIENRYLQSFKSKYGFPRFISKQLQMSASLENLYILDPHISLTNLAEAYGNNLITLTKHGNVVIESLALNIPCLISSYSRFSHFKLPHTYSTPEELRDTASKLYKSLPLKSEYDWKKLLACTLRTRNYRWDDFIDPKNNLYDPTNPGLCCSPNTYNYPKDWLS